MPRGGLSTYRHSLTALGAAVPLISAYPFIGARAQSAVYDGLACAAVLASALRARRSASGGGRWVWVLITATLALWCAGDVTSDLGSASFASSADALYLAGYPVLVAALLLLGRRLVGTPERGALLDATIVGVAFSIVGWVGIGNRYLAVDQHGVWVSTTTLLYAFGDVLLISLLAHVLIARKRITPTLAFLAVGIGFQLIADVGYSIDNTNYRVGGLLDLGWMLAYVWFAAAALLPVEDAGETAVRTARHNRLRLVLLGAALAIAPIALLSGSLDQDDRLAVGIGVALLWMLVLISAALSYRSAERLQRELEAEHELLARSEERLRLIFEHSPLSISVTDDRRQLIELNPEALAVTGYTEEEFRSLGIRGVTHPDDVDLDAGLFQELVEGKRDSFKSLKRFVRKDGGIIWGRVSYSVARAADGSVRFAIGMIEDVTQQRSAEEERDAAFEAMRASEDRFRAAFEAGGIGMVITSPKAEIVRANRAFCEITGYTEQELVGRSALEITDPEDVETSRSYLSQTHDPDLRSQSCDKRYVRKDGTSV
ncbi:MAG: PAS domain S-box protein [Actinomycetota bacterium]